MKYLSWAYGGSVSAKCVRDWITHSFLIEGQKILVKVLEAQAQSQEPKTITRAPNHSNYAASHDIHLPCYR